MLDWLFPGHRRIAKLITDAQSKNKKEYTVKKKNEKISMSLGIIHIHNKIYQHTHTEAEESDPYKNLWPTIEGSTSTAF